MFPQPNRMNETSEQKKRDFFYLREDVHVEGGAECVVDEAAVLLQPPPLGSRLDLHTLLLLLPLPLQALGQEKKTNHAAAAERRILGIYRRPRRRPGHSDSDALFRIPLHLNHGCDLDSGKGWEERRREMESIRNIAK